MDSTKNSPPVGSAAAKDHVFVYPGTLGDYLKQGTIVTCTVSLISALLVVVLVTVDRLVLGSVHVKLVHMILLAGLMVALGFVSVMMSLSLSSFVLRLTETGIVVKRLGKEDIIDYAQVKSVEKIRIPGWWPIRADLMPRGKTARHFVRINRKPGPAVTFAGGLAGEEELITMIRRKILPDGDGVGE